jgi:putative modified peptide
MADSSLSREHSLALLHKLSTDDDYRSRFEQKPAAALAELGVPHETIINLKATCLAPTTLADKGHFVQAHQELANATATTCLTMTPPTSNLDFGS